MRYATDYKYLLFCFLGLCCWSGSTVRGAATSADESYDVVIYGGNAAGVIAAVQAAEMGRSVALVEPGQHLGGLTSGGLGATDIGNKAVIGGKARDFYHRVYQHYQDDSAWRQERREDYKSRRQAPGEETMWTFEPHVAEMILEQLISAAPKVTLHRGERLDRENGMETDSGRIRSITMESGLKLSGKMFIDATYEGDLLAAAGVSYHVGRESNDTYGETINGVQLGSKYHQFHHQISPYVIEGDPASGLLPLIHDGSPGEHGQGDQRVQAYCYRMCLTDVPENRLPFPKPATYDPLNYEMFLRLILAGETKLMGNPIMMPNRKTDTNNNGPFSTDHIGQNYDYPDGDYATRERIIADHIDYQQGLMWFLANDPRVPEEIRAEANRWGLAADEFKDTGGWPHQLYVREARRMISDYVMTEHNCWGDALAEDSVGMGAYGMDSHNVQRYVDANGFATNEGDVQVHGFAPYPIAYDSIVPKRSECENLLVPVCLSASHIAYGSIRMEPVFMVLGQSAATAASQAIDQDVPVQEINREKFRERLLADGQILQWTGPRPYRGPRPDSLPGLVLDNADAEEVGVWLESRSTPGYVGRGYFHSNAEGHGEKQLRYRFSLENDQPETYRVRLSYTPHSNRATNVPVMVHAADGTHTVLVNQRVAPSEDGFLTLGEFGFAGEAVITIDTTDADGHVIADAVQLLPIE